MEKRAIWSLVVIAAAFGAIADSAYPAGRWFCFWRQDPVSNCCLRHCDDYCPKPPPCPLCGMRGGCNDYCRKPTPCFPVPDCPGCCNDYCSKPAPRTCGCPWFSTPW